ncbi:MAG: hypothetical protein K2X81_25900 [Candidatus Obscuribacterales bacterium]|nr:hypothetical protein [Candidatus Obscuribacterales bacterium]
MEFPECDLELGITEYLRTVCRYYAHFAQLVQDKFQELPYCHTVHVDVVITYSNKSFSYRFGDLGRTAKLSENQFGECLDFAISLIKPPTVEFPEEFWFRLRFASFADTYQIFLISDSISDFLARETEVISESFNSASFKPSTEHSIYQLTLNYQMKEGRCMKTLPQNPDQLDDQTENLITEHALKRIGNLTHRPEKIPMRVQMCFSTTNGKLKGLVPPISQIVELDSELHDFRGEFLSLTPEQQALSRIDSYRSRHEDHPDDIWSACNYYLALARWGPSVSQEITRSGVELARLLASRNPKSAHAHLSCAGVLEIYARSYSCQPDFVDEILYELKQAQTIDLASSEFSKRQSLPVPGVYDELERSVIKISELLIGANRYTEALEELYSSAFQAYRLPPHWSWHFHFARILRIHQKLGERDSQRRLIEESLSLLDANSDYWGRLQFELAKLNHDP